MKFHFQAHQGIDHEIYVIEYMDLHLRIDFKVVLGLRLFWVRIILWIQHIRKYVEFHIWWVLWWILIMIGFTKTWGFKMLYSSWWTWNLLEKDWFNVMSEYCINKLFWILLNICIDLWNHKHLNINISQVLNFPFMWYLYGHGVWKL